MYVVGITTQQEVYAASDTKRFRINEILIIEDSFQGNQLGEVVETNSYNRYIPMALNTALVDANVIKSLESLGYNISEDTIHIAKIRLLQEAQYPIETGCPLRVPEFNQVRDLMIKTSPDKGLVLGSIKSTDEMAEGMEEQFKDLFCLYADGKLYSQKEVPFIFDIYSMNQYPHIGIFGGSGSGKSFGLRVILEEIMKIDIPTIVFDPHFEMDFSNGSGQLDKKHKTNFNGKFRCFQIGFDVGVDFTELTSADLKNLLAASASLSDSMLNAVDMLHKSKDSYESFSERLEILAEGLEEGKDNIKRKLESAHDTYCTHKYRMCISLLEKHGNAIHLQSVRGIIWRLRRLYNDGIFNNDITFIEEALKECKLIVIQGRSRLLQVFATYLLNNFYKKRRNYKDAQYRKEQEEYFPPYMIVTDEAHNFAPKGFDVPSKSVFKEIAQEGRKYGVFLILATQRPSLLDDTVTAQLSTKFIFRTVRGTDIAAIKEETDLTSEEAKRLPYLRSGDAFVSSAVMGRTMAIRIRMAKTESPHIKNPFDELKEMRYKKRNEFIKYIDKYLPVFEGDLTKIIQDMELSKGITMNFDQIKKALDKLVNEGVLVRNKTPFGTRYENIAN